MHLQGTVMTMSVKALQLHMFYGRSEYTESSLALSDLIDTCQIDEILFNDKPLAVKAVQPLNSTL